MICVGQSCGGERPGGVNFYCCLLLFIYVYGLPSLAAIVCPFLAYGADT